MKLKLTALVSLLLANSPVYAKPDETISCKTTDGRKLVLDMYALGHPMAGLAGWGGMLRISSDRYSHVIAVQPHPNYRNVDWTGVDAWDNAQYKLSFENFRFDGDTPVEGTFHEGLLKRTKVICVEGESQ